MLDIHLKKLTSEPSLFKKGMSIGAIGSHAILTSTSNTDPLSIISRSETKTLPGFINSIANEKQYNNFLKDFFTRHDNKTLLKILKGKGFAQPNCTDGRTFCSGVISSGIIIYSIQQNDTDPMSVVTDIYESEESFWGFKNGISKNLKDFIFNIFVDYKLIYRDYL